MPAPGTAGLQNQLQVGISTLEGAKNLLQVPDVVALTGHQVPAAHVEPLQAGQVLAKLLLEGQQHLFQVKTCALAQGMEMEALDALGQFLQVIGQHAES